MFKKILIFGIVFAILFCGLQIGLENWIFNRLKQQADISIEGDFEAVIFTSKFRVRKAAIKWQEKIEAQSELIKISYSPLELLVNREIHVRIDAKVVRAKLEGDLKSLAPSSEQVFENVIAEFSVKDGEISEIYQIDAKSKDVHLKFGLSGYSDRNE